MTQPNDFARYASIIRDLLRIDPGPDQPEPPEVLRVERGQVLVSALLEPRSIDAGRIDRLAGLAREPEALRTVAVVDRQGHRRSAYRPLLIYSWVQAYRLAYETLPQAEFGRWEETLRAWCDELERSLAGAPDGAELPAARGEEVAAAAWSAAALHQAGQLFIRDAWTDLASHFFGKLARAQRDSGAFFSTANSDNPETHGYHELVILHAAASHAVQSENRSLAETVARNTVFHLNQTQPDHATNQPWGIFAFIWDQRTRSLADQLLHTVSVQQPNGARGVAAILLADALLCLRLFE